MKYITLLILLFSISINSQEVQQVEVVKNDNQISELFEELGQNVKQKVFENSGIQLNWEIERVGNR